MPSSRVATSWPISTTSTPATPTWRRCCASNAPTCSASPPRRRATRRSRSWPPAATRPRPSCARRPWPATWARRAPWWRPATSTASSSPSGIRAAGCGPTSRRATRWRPATSARPSSPAWAAPSAASPITSPTPWTACSSCWGSPRLNGCWATSSARRTAGSAAGPARRWPPRSSAWKARRPTHRRACGLLIVWKARRPTHARHPRRPGRPPARDRRPGGLEVDERRTPTSSWAPTA